MCECVCMCMHFDVACMDINIGDGLKRFVLFVCTLCSYVHVCCCFNAADWASSLFMSDFRIIFQCMEESVNR
jgi:hypothetical protein